MLYPFGIICVSLPAISDSHHQLPSPNSAQGPMLAIELTIQKVIPAQQNRPMKSTMVCIHWGASGKLMFGGPYPTSLLVNIYIYPICIYIYVYLYH